MLGTLLANLRWAYWWNSTESWPDDVTKDQVCIELNTDFSTKGLSAQEVMPKPKSAFIAVRSALLFVFLWPFATQLLSSHSCGELVS